MRAELAGVIANSGMIHSCVPKLELVRVRANIDSANITGRKIGGILYYCYGKCRYKGKKLMVPRKCNHFEQLRGLSRPSQLGCSFSAWTAFNGP